MKILKLGDFDAVRASIDTDLDEVGLPNATIALPIFVGIGEADVVRRDPLALTRSDPDEQEHIRNAAIFFTASYLVLRLPRAIKEAFGNKYTVTRQEVSRQDLAAALRGLANDELDAYLVPGSSDAERPTMFSVTTGCGRGKFHTGEIDVPF